MGQSGSCDAALTNSTANSTVIYTTIGYTINATDDDFPHYLYWSIEEMQTIIWPVFLYILGLCYTFTAIALICDESSLDRKQFFVPALDKIVDRYNIPPNIAGATFMAAGGSMPELATTMVGTFSESAVGFGTIVGSAVFNVLLVIGVCAFLSREVLELSYWPLFRDSTYYCACLGLLAVFYGVTTPNRITWSQLEYESLILLCLYGVYVAIMKYNERLKKMGKRLSKRMGWFAVTQVDGDALKTFAQARGIDKDGNHEICKSEFADFMRKMGHAPTEAEIAGVLTDFNVAERDTVTEGEFVKWYIRSKLHVQGSVIQKFSTWNQTDDAMLTQSRLTEMVKELGVMDVTHAQVLAKEAFDSCRATMMGSLSQHTPPAEDQKSVSETEVIDFKASPQDTKHAMNTPTKQQPRIAGAVSPAPCPRIAFRDFKAWLSYNPPSEDDEEPLWIEWPTKKSVSGDSCCKLVMARFMFIWTVPLVVLMVFTVPDVRRPPTKICSWTITWENWWFAAFVLSIGWITFFSWLMVWWTEVLGEVFGLPSAFMGLTFLAAGTSIPDLFSSVIVARKGLGDMAVSSSIGSNIFDILIGLPLPWLIYAIYKGIVSFGKCKNAQNVPQPNEWCFATVVEAKTLLFSVLLLIAMIASVIIAVACSGWRMTRCLGVLMLVGYVGFVAQDVLRNCDIVPAVAQYFQWLP